MVNGRTSFKNKQAITQRLLVCLQGLTNTHTQLSKSYGNISNKQHIDVAIPYKGDMSAICQLPVSSHLLGPLPAASAS
jgi:hypothetical protein